jgi:hypothetical protein
VPTPQCTGPAWCARAPTAPPPTVVTADSEDPQRRRPPHADTPGARSGKGGRGIGKQRTIQQGRGEEVDDAHFDGGEELGARSGGDRTGGAYGGRQPQWGQGRGRD